MKSVKVISTFAAVIFVAFFLGCNILAQEKPVLHDRISLEFEYMDRILERSVVEGDMQGIAEAHIILSNLHANLKQVQDPERQARFTIAAGYEYVKMCPAVYFLQLYQPDNPTGFTIDCVKTSQALFSEAVGIADSKLKGTPAADTYFFAGLGMDRLKANLSNVPGAETEAFFTVARDYMKKAHLMGTSFNGAETILSRLDKKEYLTAPVIGDFKFREVSRTLIFGNIVPVIEPEKTPQVVSRPSADSGIDKLPQATDENTYIDYKWRFSIKRPDDSWIFAPGRSGEILQLSVRKKNSTEQRGSGLNITCSNLRLEDEGKPLQAIVEKSINMLKNAGYADVEGANIQFAGYPAYEVKSVLSYIKDLIPAKDVMDEPDIQGSSSSEMASRQYMIIVVANGIQYVISFSSFSNEYPRVFPMYHEMAETLTIF